MLPLCGRRCVQTRPTDLPPRAALARRCERYVDRNSSRWPVQPSCWVRGPWSTTGRRAGRSCAISSIVRARASSRLRYTKVSAPRCFGSSHFARRSSEVESNFSKAAFYWNRGLASSTRPTLSGSNSAGFYAIAARSWSRRNRATSAGTGPCTWPGRYCYSSVCCYPKGWRQPANRNFKRPNRSCGDVAKVGDEGRVGRICASPRAFSTKGKRMSVAGCSE